MDNEKILPDCIDMEALRVGLYSVVSQSEAQMMWAKSQKTIDMARWRGRLQCRKSGKQWLITVASLVALYGQPKNSMTSHAEDSGQFNQQSEDLS